MAQKSVGHVIWRFEAESHINYRRRFLLYACEFFIGPISANSSRILHYLLHLNPAPAQPQEKTCFVASCYGLHGVIGVLA